MSDLRKGFDPNFLGEEFKINLPVPSLEIEEDILKKDEFRDEIYVDYIHYSVMMSKTNKAALFSAANLDQKDYKQVAGRRWFIDPRISMEYQTGNNAYFSNPWDRGHLTRRTAVTWGTRIEAKRASNDSCSYANASLQHENFNQDEWRVPEQIIQHFVKDKNDKLSIFTGPIYTEADRWFTNNNRLEEAVRIPSGFWKIVAYIDKETNRIACQAYIMYQDKEFLADKRGKENIKIQNYQVTITEIERLTGLEFDKVLFETNPLYYYPRTGINRGPEAFTTPTNLTNEELNKGIVFSREDAESEKFKERKIEILEEDLF